LGRSGFNKSNRPLSYRIGIHRSARLTLPERLLSFFYLNPRGTKYARLAGGRATKLEWEGDWQAAARIVADGWTAEMAIPWSILNYPTVKGPTTIGINFLRFHKRANMISNWSNID
jgi:hypothetical protein